MTVLCNQPEAFASDLGDNQSHYLFAYVTEIFSNWWEVAFFTAGLQLDAVCDVHDQQY